jgi:hypothetical protein
MKILSFITFILIFTSCSPAPETTKAKISFGAALASVDFPGGLYILAHNEDTKEALMRKVGINELTIELPNGKWEFGAIGWDASSNKMMGAPKCFMGNPANLDGKDISVDLTINTSGCGLDPFKSDNHNQANGTPRESRFISCGNLVERGFDKDNTPVDYLCDDFSGKYKSFKVSLFDVPLSSTSNFGQYATNENKSECLDNGGNNYSSSTGFYMPMFSGIPQKITAYDSASCGGTSTELFFQQGLSKAYGSLNKGFAIGNTSNNSNDIYLDNELCDANAIASTNTFESGNGSSNSPYVICSASELSLMDNEPSSYYFLGANINGTGNTTNTGTFSGNFDGNDKTITGLSQSIFTILGNTSKVSNLTLKNITLSTVNANFGLISEQILLSTSATSEVSNINIINIDLTNTNTTGTGACAFGALIGNVVVSSANSLKIKDVTIFNENNNQNNMESNGGSCQTGGLIGATQSSNKEIVNIESITIMNLDISNNDFDTGGLIGNANKATVTKTNINQVNITGKDNVGGIIGYSTGSMVNLSSFIAEIDNGERASLNCIFDNDNFSSPSLNASNCKHFGGIIGYALQGNFINHVLSIFKIDDNNDVIDLAGGVIGYSYSSTAANIISNAGAYLKAEMNGNSIGGLVGLSQENGSLGGRPAHIYSSIALGNIHIKEVNSIFDNSKRGGLVGQFKSSVNQLKMSLAQVTIQGTDEIGGIAGFSEGNINETYFTGTIEADVNDEAGDYSIGGIVGINGASARVRNSMALFAATVLNYPTNPCDGATKRCGLIAGKNLNASDTDDAIALHSVAFGTSTFNTLGYNGTVRKVVGGSTYASEILASSSPALTGGSPDAHSLIIDIGNYNQQPWIFHGGKDIPLFAQKWLTMGYDIGESKFLLGNAFDPFLINSTADWNSIQDDAFLLTKTMALNAPLDFTGQIFYPIGGHWNSTKIVCDSSKQFTGMIFGSPKDHIPAHSLSNITIDIDGDYDSGSCSGSALIGIVSHLGDYGSFPAIFGIPEQPIPINNLAIINSSTIDPSYVGGIAGNAMGAQISANLNNANINLTNSGTNAGGFVGYARALGIINSRFQGSVDAANYTTAGGLIGSQDTGHLQVANSRVSPTLVSGYNYTGGLAGTIGSSSSITNNIVEFKNDSDRITGTNSGAGYASGFVAKFVNLGGVSSNLLYIKPVNLSGTADTEKFFHAYSGVDSVDNYVINTSADDSSNANAYFATENEFLNSGSLSKFRGVFKDTNDGQIKQYWE